MSTKKYIIKNILDHLAEAYMASNGEIADLPEFTIRGDRYLNLSLPYEGIALWVEVGKIIEKKKHTELELGREREEFASRARHATK